MSRKKNLPKINKGKLKNLLKRKSLSNKNGSATAETILITAVLLVIVIAVFYPQLRNILQSTFTSISNWYNNTLSNMGIF